MYFFNFYEEIILEHIPGLAFLWKKKISVPLTRLEKHHYDCHIYNRPMKLAQYAAMSIILKKLII
jgi:hypothetical protein